MATIGEIATNILNNEFDGDTGVIAVSSISGWLDANVGTLNTLINQDFTTGEDFGQEEETIFSKLYLHSYYTKQSRNALRGIITNSSNLLSVAEGDSRVSFVNKNEVSKVYKGLSTDAWNELQRLAHKYNMYQSPPSQVVETR